MLKEKSAFDHHQHPQTPSASWGFQGTPAAPTPQPVCGAYCSSLSCPGDSVYISALKPPENPETNLFNLNQELPKHFGQRHLFGVVPTDILIKMCRTHSILEMADTTWGPNWAKPPRRGRCGICMGRSKSHHSEVYILLSRRITAKDSKITKVTSRICSCGSAGEINSGEFISGETQICFTQMIINGQNMLLIVQPEMGQWGLGKRQGSPRAEGVDHWPGTGSPSKATTLRAATALTPHTTEHTLFRGPKS